MYFYNPNEREVKELISGIHARTFWGENLMLAVVELDAGSILPTHTHLHEQGGIVLDGTLEFSIDGETRTLVPGDIYIIPGGVNHKVTVGENHAKVLDIFSPVREEYKY